MAEQVQVNPTNSLGKVEGRYNTLEARRNPYLLRAWDCAELTIPSLLPRNGTTATTNLPVPWQSIGSRGVNHLASKLLLATMPPNTPFFRERVDDFVFDQMAADTGEDPEVLRSKIEEALAKVERSVMTYIEKSTDRVSVWEAFRHLLVTGNALLFRDPKKGMRVFSLNHYVCRRSPSGAVLEIIIKEQIDPSELPKPVREQISVDPSGNEYVCLYTMIKRQKDNWEVYQEAAGIEVPGTRSSHPIDKSYWLPLRFIKIDGEHYGRGYVEGMLGDLRSLEALQQAVVEGSAAAAKVLFLVKPNGSTRPKVLKEAPNGAIVHGNAEEVTVLRLDKAQDFAVAKDLHREIKQDLSLAFLLSSAIQRDAERVTAEEIRFMAEELEQTLGGFYTILAVEFQIPYVAMVKDEMQKKRRLPPLPKDHVKTTIVTGLEALGRGHELAKLNAWVQSFIGTWGPEIAAQRLNVDEIERRRALAHGIEIKGLIKGEAQVAQETQDAQQNQLMNSVAPNLVNAGGKLLQEGMKNGGAGQGQAAPAS